MDKVIFIDRDGVINVDLMGDYIKTREEFEFEAGAVEALKMFSSEGYKIVLISNQAGVGDGVFSEEALWDVHQYMLDELKNEGVEIEATHYCLCSKTDEGCDCRKPKTGMFVKAARDIAIDKSITFYIGDKATDIAAGQNFGLKTAFVRTGHGKNDESKFNSDFSPDLRADNFLEVTKMILLS